MPDKITLPDGRTVTEKKIATNARVRDVLPTLQPFTGELLGFDADGDLCVFTVTAPVDQRQVDFPKEEDAGEGGRELVSELYDELRSMIRAEVKQELIKLLFGGLRAVSP